MTVIDMAEKTGGFLEYFSGQSQNTYPITIKIDGWNVCHLEGHPFPSSESQTFVPSCWHPSGKSADPLGCGWLGMSL